MKDQYFGDINDYRKYGLLRSIVDVSKLRLLIVWMLTADDGSTDGKFISYLEHPEKWSSHDPILFKKIKKLLDHAPERRVSLIEQTGLLKGAKYFSKHAPDSKSDRSSWFELLVKRSQESDLVFLDPDNGFEVESKPYGRKNSSKFVYRHEIEALWSSGKSLLIYQHFIREARLSFIQRMMDTLERATPNSLVEAFSTPHVVFLLALQPNHQCFHEEITNTVQKKWEGQIKHWQLVKPSQH